MNKKRKCDHCGVVNWRESESCFNCNKVLEPAAKIYDRSAARIVHPKKSAFFSFKLGATTAIIITLIILVAVASTVYFNSVIDKTSKVSLMTRYYWNIEPPNKKMLWEAVSAATVVDSDDGGKVIQEPALSYRKDCKPLDRCPENAPMVIDLERSRPAILETENVRLNDFFVVSSRVDKVKASAGKPEFIRYTARVEADITRATIVKEQEFKTGKDGSSQKRESSKIEITLKWNPTKLQWEMP